MSLERADILDAVGIDKSSRSVILTILDSWDWTAEREHLLALEAKLNAYFAFVESGQILASYPNAKGRPIVIDVVTRFPLARSATVLLQKAAKEAANIGVAITSRQVPKE